MNWKLVFKVAGGLFLVISCIGLLQGEPAMAVDLTFIKGFVLIIYSEVME